MELVVGAWLVVVFPCRNSFLAFLGKFVCFSESQEKSAEKSGKRKHTGTH
jgi:hypothetical protein